MPTKPKSAARTKGASAPAKPAQPAPLRINATAPGEARAETFAKLAADGVLPLTLTAQMFGRPLAGGECDVTAMHGRLMETAKDAEAGNMGRLERMLSAQAQTLNIMFTELARRAALNMGEHMQATEVYLRMAFKAQAQSRATVEALAEVKNPRSVAFVKAGQANFAQQQINHGAPASHAHARESAIPANELSRLEAPNEWSALEAGTQAAPARGHPAMEALGEVHRPEDA